MIREIPLTQGKVALVDEEDYDRLVAMGSWCAVKNHRTFYARTRVSRTRTVGMHNVILGVERGTDHINGDGLDNRRENLRPATQTQNSRNRRVRHDNRSGFKGVNMSRTRKGTLRYQARIWVEGRSINLGRYSTPEAAREAYEQAALKYHGEFAS